MRLNTQTLSGVRAKDSMENLFSKNSSLPAEHQVPKTGLGFQVHTVSGLNCFPTFEVQL